MGEEVEEGQTATTQTPEQSTEKGGAAAGGESTPQQTQTAAGEQAGEGPESQRSEQNRGDKSVALRQEREKRREEQKRNKKLQQQLQELRQGQEIASAGSGQHAGEGEELELSEGDLDDPEILKNKIDQHIERKVNSRTRQAREEMESSQEMSGEVDRLLSQYEIFTQEDDPEIRQDAIRVASDDIAELPKGSTMDDAEQVIGQVAKRYDQYRAKRASQSTESQAGKGPESETEGPATVGAGTAASTHYSPSEGPAGSIKEAGKRAKERYKRTMGAGASP